MNALVVFITVFALGYNDDGDTTDEDREDHPIEMVVARPHHA